MSENNQLSPLVPRVQTFVPESTPGEYVVLDRSNPRAVINLVPESWVRAIERLAQEFPEFMDLDERSLKEEISKAFKAKKIREGLTKINPTDNRIRMGFWNEYNRACDRKKPMVMSSVYAGVCTAAYADHEVIARPQKLAWILTPPTSYTNTMEEALLFGIECLRDILETPLRTSSGGLDVKAAELVLKTVQFLDQRVKGAVVQKVDTRSLIMHGKVEVPALAQPQSIEEVKEQLAKLEDRTRLVLDGARAPLQHQYMQKTVEVLEPEFPNPVEKLMADRFEE